MEIKPSLLLCNAPRIPLRYTATVKDALAAAWGRLQWHIREKFGFTALLMPPEQLERTFFAEELALLARAAAGEVEREQVGEVYETLQDVMEFLFASCAPTSTYIIPEEFWATPLGQMLEAVKVWLRGDEIWLTTAEAARRAGVSIQAVRSAIREGRLPAVQRGKRRYIAASDVDKLYPKSQ